MKVNNKTRRFWSKRIYLSINKYEVQESVQVYHAEQQDNSTYTGKFHKDLKNRCYKNVQYRLLPPSPLAKGFLSTSLLTNGEMQNKNPRLGKMISPCFTQTFYHCV